MEWRNYYMDLIFVPFGLVMILAYHVWLSHKSQTQPFATTFGRDVDGRRLWVPAMIKDIDRKNIVAIQCLRNLIMGSTLMATTAILICAGLGAIISSTYSVKKVVSNTIFGAHDGFVLGLKYAIILAIFFFSFLCHTFSISFLNQLNILICTPQDAKSLVTSQYLTQLLEKAILLNTAGNRLFYSAFPLLLWIFGPLLTFFSSMVMVILLYNLDFVTGNSDRSVHDFIPNSF
ncbi:hypothetical protein VNO78_32706 [Psophocarpus tetragonolobus]|uniref:DUF599 domain-containing protein n=1 Tax=Psophocarpus tetragonolobus TaxID=3891 RepID=A0AAN9RS45_PSOTE